MPEPTPAAPRGVVIDLDDTLLPLQTLERWQWAWRPNGPVLAERHARAAIRRALRAWDRRRWRGLVGSEPATTWDDYRRHLEATLHAIADRPLPDGEVSAVVERFLRPAGPLERYPDVEPALRTLASRSLPYVILSAVPESIARPLLHRAGEDDRPLLAPPADSCPPPDRAAFQQAVRALGVPAPHALYLGDLYWSDVRAAARAGLTPVLVDRDGRMPPATGRRISSLRELPALLDEAPNAATSGPGPRSNSTDPETPTGD